MRVLSAFEQIKRERVPELSFTNFLVVFVRSELDLTKKPHRNVS